MSEAPNSFEIETISPVVKKIKGTIPWETVKAKFDETYKELGKSVSLKGFRRGKVPQSLLKRMFQKHIERDLTNELIREASVEVIKANPEAIHAVDTPNDWKIFPGELTDGQAFPYEVEIEVIPEVEVKDYEGIEVTKLVVPVKDEEIEHQIEHLQKHLTKVVPVEEGSVEPGHTVTLNIMGKIDGAPLNFEGEQIIVPEGDDFDQGSIPLRIATSLRGKPVQEIEQEFEHELVFGDNAGEYSGKTGSFFIEFQEVTRKVTPELNDDFAKESGEAETLDELRTKLTEKIQKQHDDQSNTLLERALMDEVIKRNGFELGQSLITRQAELKIEQTLMSLGIPLESADMGEYKKNLVESYRGNAERELRENLLLESLSKQVSIEVTDEDLDAKLAEIAEKSGESIERVRAEYQKENRIDTLKYVLKLTKTLDFLKSQSKINEEEAEAFPQPSWPGKDEDHEESDHDHE